MSIHQFETDQLKSFDDRVKSVINTMQYHLLLYTDNTTVTEIELRSQFDSPASYGGLMGVFGRTLILVCEGYYLIYLIVL